MAQNGKNTSAGKNMKADWNESGAGVYLPYRDDVMHLVEMGTLVCTWFDIETTDKEWQTLEPTAISLKTTDIGYNLISDNLYMARVPDRVALNPEAMLITRYPSDQVRDDNDPSRLPPQIATARVFEDVQAAPARLWEHLGDRFRQKLGEALWKDYVNERYVDMPKKNGETEQVLVRHFPVLDSNNNVTRDIRVHAPKSTRRYLNMSYRVDPGGHYDYSDEEGYWRIRRMGKHNFGFRNTYFDNRAFAAMLFRANFPVKQIYALNRKGLGNYAADAFSMALAHHFFSPKGRKRLKLGRKTDPSEVSHEQISASLDKLMAENTRNPDPDIDLPQGIRVYDGTIANPKRGHNDPGYDNDKAIGLHSYIRNVAPDVAKQVEQCADIDAFRRFMTHDNEDNVPTTNPVRFIITSANDSDIYRVVPIIVLGSDDEHGKFNRIWGIRADIDYREYEVEGKRLIDMSTAELASLIRNQRGQIGAIFHEVNLKRPKGAVVDAETGLKAGHAPGHTLESLRYVRDLLCEYRDDYDLSFVQKALDAWGHQRSFRPFTDDTPQPYAEEEIWTAMGDVQYHYIVTDEGEKVRLPNIIREMAQNEFKRINHRIGDTARELLRPQPCDWDMNEDNALDYAKKRKEVQDKLAKYQAELPESRRIELPAPAYDPAILKANYKGQISIEDIFATSLIDRLYLMDKVVETTQSFDVEKCLYSHIQGKYIWQRIPFEDLAHMPEDKLTWLKNEDSLRVNFERNPNHWTYRFGMRFFWDNGMKDLLTQLQRDFCKAENAVYLGGPPYLADPSEHRVMSVPKSQKIMERISENVRPDTTSLQAGREGEMGGYELYVGDNDQGDAILDSIRRDNNRLLKTYPLTNRRMYNFGIDPSTGQPMQHVKHELSPEKTKVINIPDAHTDMPVEQTELGNRGFVVPRVGDIEKADHIVFREETTGRQYYAASAVINPLPSRKQGEYQAFWEQVDAAYNKSGRKPPGQGYVVSCAELVPMAEMGKPSRKAVHIDQEQLIATRAPRLGMLAHDTPLTAFVVRQYDLALEDGEKIRLRGTGDDGHDTGWEAKTRVKGKPREMVLRDVIAMIDDPEQQEKADAMALHHGFGTAEDMKKKLLNAFTRFDEDINDTANTVLFFDVAPVKKLDYWTPKQPKACWERRFEDLRPEGQQTNAPIVSPRHKRNQAPEPD